MIINAEGYDNLVKSAIELAKSNNASLEQKYKMGTWERWDIDQEVGLLKFSSNGIEKLVFKACIIGSTSAKSKTWLWSWANKSILPLMSSETQKVKDFGLKNGFAKLSEAKWDADEIDGWEVAAISSKLINGIGVYRGPSGNGFIFIVPTELVKYDP